MNRWTGTAYLTRDPERVDTPGGTTICLLRVGVERGGRNGKDGYFDVKAFNGQAVACLEHLVKGRRVAIDGRLQHEEFKTKDNDYASRVSIVADWVEFLPTPRRREDVEEQAEPQQPAAAPEEAAAPASS